MKTTPFSCTCLTERAVFALNRTISQVRVVIRPISGIRERSLKTYMSCLSLLIWSWSKAISPWGCTAWIRCSAWLPSTKTAHVYPGTKSGCPFPLNLYF